MFSKTLRLSLCPVLRLRQLHQFHATTFVLTLMWLTLPWKCPNNEKSTRRWRKRKKRPSSKFNNVTFRVSEARENISLAREHSLRLSARDHSPLLHRSGRAVDSALCNGPCCVPRPPPPALIIEPIQNGVNGSGHLKRWARTVLNARSLSDAEYTESLVEIMLWTVNCIPPKLFFRGDWGKQEIVFFYVVFTSQTSKKSKSTMLTSQFFTSRVNIYFSSLSLPWHDMLHSFYVGFLGLWCFPLEKSCASFQTVHSEKISGPKTEDFCFRDKVKVTDELITSKTVGRDGVSLKQA